MENYIINPMWFYWLHVVNNLGNLLWVLAGIAGIAAICLGAFFVNYKCYAASELKAYGEDDRDYKRGISSAAILRKPFLISSVVATILTLLAEFCPSRDTLISMMVAKFATYDNAQWTVDAIKSAVDYIVQAIQSVR